MYNHNEQYSLDNMEHEGGASGTPAHQPRESYQDQPWPRVEPGMIHGVPNNG